MTATTEDPLIFAGSASRKLGAEIAGYLQPPLGSGEVIQFSEGNLFVRVLENVRGLHVFLIQSTVFPANDQFMELLFWVDALKRASAASVTAVIPYFSYAKGDKKDEPRVSIRRPSLRRPSRRRGWIGWSRWICMHRRCKVFSTFRSTTSTPFPFSAKPSSRKVSRIWCWLPPMPALPEKRGDSPDVCEHPWPWPTRIRPDHSERAEILSVMGEVRERTALVVDDFVSSGGTLAQTAVALKELGAATVYAAVTHGLFTENTMKVLDQSPIELLFVTNSVVPAVLTLSPKVEVVSVGPLLVKPSAGSTDGRALAFSSIEPTVGAGRSQNAGDAPPKPSRSLG